MRGLAYFQYLFFTSLLVIVFSVTSIAQELIRLDQKDGLSQIGKKTLYFEDTTLKLSIQDILSDSIQGKFSTCLQDAPNFSATNSAYWLKLEVEKSIPGNFYLEVGTAFMDSISLYEFNAQGVHISTRYAGDDLPFGNREVRTGNYLFALDFDQGTTRVLYLRIQSHQPLFFPLRVGTLESFMAFTHDLDFVQGIYFGFMLLIFLYNLFLYFSIREKIYLYYIGYVFSITWFMASVYGYFFEYFWPNMPWINQNVVVTSGLTMIAATFFTRKFLNTKTESPKLHIGTYLFIGIGFLVCVFVLSGFKLLGLQLAQGGLLLMAAYFLYLGIRFKVKGYGPAKYYLLAWGALFIGICLAMLESLNLIPIMPYLNAMQIGSGLEVLLLSFALGDKINAYKKQKEDAQADSLEAAKKNQRLIQEQNTLLEKKVVKRTKKIAKQNEKLILLNEEKNALISVVAHDLRTPLNQIRGLIQLLDMISTNLNEEQQKYMNQMDGSADRLTHMISRILNVNALESKQINLKTQVLDVTEVVEYVINCFQPSASDKNINIKFEHAEHAHYADIDRNYFIQVLENLISNALKFSDKGSEIHLRVITENKRTRIEVEDEGPGISDDDKKKLFGRFQRLTAQPTNGEASTGLGLSIVKKYIEAMKGNITCESELGEGTKFIVTFEAKEQLVAAVSKTKKRP